MHLTYELAQKPFLLNAQVESDSRGSLFITEGKTLPFDIARIFTILPKKIGEIRGEHAHKTCWQYFLSVSGNMEVEIRNISSEDTFQISPGTGLVVPPWNWSKIVFGGADSILNVFASHSYDASDYIFDPPKRVESSVK